MSALQTNVQQEINKLQQTSAYVELYTLDASAFGGGIFNFTNQLGADGNPVVFGGTTYIPIPVIGQGFDITSSGTMPKPTITVSNVFKPLLASVISLGDLVGAKVLRIRTYEKFLDGQSSANPSAFIGPEKWVIEQKVQHDKHVIQWTLTTPLDRLGFKFGRQCLKDPSVKNLYCPGISRNRVQ
jgi:lambda family phage minor tail protein L